MNLLFLGMTISVLGKALLAIGVLLAHSKIAHEHRIDNEVLRTFRTEFVITLIGLIMIVVGYMLEVMFFGGFVNFAYCNEAECAASIISVFQ